jgi:hypothetical protein
MVKLATLESLHVLDFPVVMLASLLAKALALDQEVNCCFLAETLRPGCQVVVWLYQAVVHLLVQVELCRWKLATVLAKEVERLGLLPGPQNKVKPGICYSSRGQQARALRGLLTSR